MNAPRDFIGEVLPDENIGQHHDDRNSDPRAVIPDAQDADDFDFDTTAYKDNGDGARAEHDERSATLADFRAYMPQHNYFYLPTREPWPAASVNARVDPVPLLDEHGRPVLNDKGEEQTMMASKWLDKNQHVEQMTWSPGLPMLVYDQLVSDGGWFEKKGDTCLNLYRPPIVEAGDATRAGLWLDHVRKIYPDDADHIVMWLAARVQHPEQKINHALVLGGPQGVGKDTLLAPVKYAVGHWNFIEVSPQQIMGRFNGYLRSVILRVSEVRDLGDVDRYGFYEHTKALTASPPDVLRVDEKNLREYSIFNVTGIVYTTNNKAGGIFLPSDDRRHYVAWSTLKKEDFAPDYWSSLWRWYQNGGIRHVAEYLNSVDISAFDIKAPPPKTAAFWEIVDAGRSPEEAELADVLDQMGNPDAITIARLTAYATGGFAEFITDRRNRRAIPHKLERCGYVPIRNDTANDGLWKLNGARQAIYAKATLSVRDRFQAARRLFADQGGR